jgi:hypothetical protein
LISDERAGAVTDHQSLLQRQERRGRSGAATKPLLCLRMPKRAEALFLQISVARGADRDLLIASSELAIDTGKGNACDDNLAGVFSALGFGSVHTKVAVLFARADRGTTDRAGLRQGVATKSGLLPHSRFAGSTAVTCQSMFSSVAVEELSCTKYIEARFSGSKRKLRDAGQISIWKRYAKEHCHTRMTTEHRWTMG